MVENRIVLGYSQSFFNFLLKILVFEFFFGVENLDISENNIIRVEASLAL
jgi:hypothetical protein